MQAIEKGRALVQEEYKRSVKARKVRAASAFRAVINEELGRLVRRAPAFLRPSLTDRVRSNTRKWILRIDKALRSGELDAFNVHRLMSAAVKSFLQAATGTRTDDAALEALQASGRSAVAALAKPYYEPEHVCRSEREARLSIDRGKELIEKWV